MCPHEYKLRLIMTTLARYNHNPINIELLGHKIKIFKRKYNYTYAQLSAKFGVNQSSIKKWALQLHKPNINSYNRIMNYLENHN